MRLSTIVWIFNCALLVGELRSAAVRTIAIRQDQKRDIYDLKHDIYDVDRLSEQQRVTATQGENVILPCHLDFPDGVPVSYVVQWKKINVEIPVFIWYKGYPPHHGVKYKGRVSLADQASLNLTTVNQTDQGWYACKIGYLNRGISTKSDNGSLVYLEVLAQPFFIEKPPETVYSSIGDVVEIPCRASGTPRPVIEWFKDRVKMFTNDRIDISSKKLVINGVSRADVADYMCKATNKEGDAFTSVKIIIAGGAVITIPPQNNTLLEGNKAEFQCESKALPSNLTHQWYKNDMPVEDFPRLSRRSSVLEDGTLVIDRAVFDDSGKYTCKVTNGIGQQQSASAYLDVQYAARVTYNPSVQYLPLGLPGVLNCNFESNPPALYVRWVKDNENIHPETPVGIEMLRNNGSLLFEKIKVEHQGRYTCTPHNIHGTAGKSSIIEVLVKAPPTFTAKPSRKYVRTVNTDVEIRCQGSGVPNPKIYWRRADGRSLPKLRSKVLNGRLSLKGLKKEDYGYYECVLMNEIATLMTNTLLIVNETSPHPPTNVSVGTGVHTATLTWLPGYDGGFSQQYLIWYKLADDGENTWKKIIVPGDSTVFTIHNLEKNVPYDFKVQSKNNLGDGSSSRMVRAKTKYSIFPTDMSGPISSNYQPGATVPAKSFEMSATSNSQNQVVLSWSYPSNHSVPILQFTIEHSLNPEGPWQQLQNIISPPIKKLTIPDVKGGATHYYRVKAHFELALPIVSRTVNVYVSAPRAVDKEKAITAGIVGGLLFFIVAIILAICAVKICNNRKRRKAEKAYMMVTCPVPVGVNGGSHIPSPVPLKNSPRGTMCNRSGENQQGRIPGIRGYFFDCCYAIWRINLMKPMVFIQSRSEQTQTASIQEYHPENQQIPHLHESYGNEHELDMLPRSVRRFPKAVRYNVKMEYSQPPGWIRRTPEGKFVLSRKNYEDDDDGGFLSMPHHISGSPIYQAITNDGRQTFCMNSPISINSTQSMAEIISPNDPRFHHFSGSMSFGKGEIPSVFVPHDPRFRTSSPGFAHLEGFRPVFNAELSSVMQQSSVERSFPSMLSSRLITSMQNATPVGITTNTSPSVQQELSSLGVIHEHVNPLHEFSQQFRPIHRPIPRQRILQYHPQILEKELSRCYPGTPSPYMRIRDENFNHQSFSSSNQASHHHNVYSNLPPRRKFIPNHVGHTFSREANLARSGLRVSSAPLPGDMMHSPTPKINHFHQFSRFDPNNLSSRLSPMHHIHFNQRHSPGPQVPPKPSKFNQIYFTQPRSTKFGPHNPNFHKFTPTIVSHANERNIKEVPSRNAEGQSIPSGPIGQRTNFKGSPNIFNRIHSPNIGSKCDRFTPISIRTTPLSVPDNRLSPPHIHPLPKFLSQKTALPHDHHHQFSHRINHGPSPLSLPHLNHKIQSRASFHNQQYTLRDKQIARILPSPSKNVRPHSSCEKTKLNMSPCNTLGSSTTDNQPIEYTRDRLQGVIERVRGTALSRGSMDQPFRGSAPELSITALSSDPTASDENNLLRRKMPVSVAVAERRGALSTGCSSIKKSEGDPTLNMDTNSVVSWTSSGRGSKAASIVHSHVDSFQDELNFSQVPSSSSGFGSRNTSNQQSTNSGSPTGQVSTNSLQQFQESKMVIESPQSEPPNICNRSSYMNPLNISVDENYEFDSVSPLDSDLLEKLRHRNSRRGSSSSGERGISDSEIYITPKHPRSKRPIKYDNSEARCYALKQEFLRFRQRQDETQHTRYRSELESSC